MTGNLGNLLVFALLVARGVPETRPSIASPASPGQGQPLASTGARDSLLLGIAAVLIASGIALHAAKTNPPRSE